jgi:hypothetical protein
MDMQKERSDWLGIAITVSSYRQMYCLADRIVGSAEATHDDRRAARKVVSALRDVIDQPIAAHNVLMRARKKFDALVRTLDAA